MALSVNTCVAQHIGDRQDQQDRVALYPHTSRSGLLVAVLADGMGGHTGGAIAAEQVLHKAKYGFEAFAPAVESASQLLQTIVEEAHVAIKLTRFTSESDPHSTAVVLLLQSGRVDWAYCGDSRVYHFRDRTLVARSMDHSLVSELVRRGRIRPEQAATHPHRNVLLHCLGGQQRPRIDFGEAAPLVAGDTFLLCSDGLWAYFDDAELAEVLALHAPREAAEMLIGHARERATGSGDNISLAIVKVSEQDGLEG